MAQKLKPSASQQTHKSPDYLWRLFLAKDLSDERRSDNPLKKVIAVKFVLSLHRVKRWRFHQFSLG